MEDACASYDSLEVRSDFKENLSEIRNSVPVMPISETRRLTQSTFVDLDVDDVSSNYHEPNWTRITREVILENDLRGEIPWDAFDLMFVSGEQFTDA